MVFIFIPYFLVEKPEGKKPLWCRKRRPYQSIKINLTQGGHEEVFWIHLVQGMDL
jgi:hypothetical protein